MLEIIQEKLKGYTIHSKIEEENAIKEICQDIALAGLARTNFFKQAAFQGGTCLRILYQLRRFSEDLDFVLTKPNSHFNWAPYLAGITTEFESFGLHCDTIDRSKVEGNIKKAFLKEDSFGQVLNLRFQRDQADIQKILIKLEIDVNPPAGSSYSTNFLEYPYPFSILTPDLNSLFAGKCHALLCREYVKGRDWYDFLWYVHRKTPINLMLLKNALEQCGPYQGKNIPISNSWLVEQFSSKIPSIDWPTAIKDVKRFLQPNEEHTISAWSTEMFMHTLNQMESYL